MAYQVISQNNTTTTLADENGNIIRVPARVSLATSTDYTIKKVNNSTATLEDGNGNIIRDVPCVAVLVGGEGGGGGAVSSVNGQTGDVVITGNDVLPDQTGQIGKFLTTDGTDASWSDKPLVNRATGTASLTIQGTPCSSFAGINIGDNSFCGGIGVAIGRYSEVRSSSNGAVAIGNGATSRANYGVVVGNGLVSANNAIQLGCRSSQPTNSDANTFKVANAYGNYEIMSADGTIPAARHASLPAADGTYTLQLVIADGVPTLSWVAE